MRIPRAGGRATVASRETRRTNTTTSPSPSVPSAAKADAAVALRQQIVLEGLVEDVHVADARAKISGRERVRRRRDGTGACVDDSADDAAAPKAIPRAPPPTPTPRKIRREGQRGAALRGRAARARENHGRARGGERTRIRAT